MTASIDFIALQSASRAFATEAIPDDWQEMNDDERETWLEDHRYRHFESLDNDEFFSLIEDHSDTIKEAINISLKLLKEKLVEAAIESQLPDDFNQLNLKEMIGLKVIRTALSD